MRKIDYISPTSLNLFYRDRERYYLEKLSDCPFPRMQQTEPMAAGSAFDAYVKSYLMENLLCTNPDPRFALEELLTQQVEEHNRDEARNVGKWLFQKYCDSGALADLMVELELSTTSPRFEFELTGTISSASAAQGFMLCLCAKLDADGNIHYDPDCPLCGGDGEVIVPFRGHPDCSFRTSSGLRVTDDWKVNGFYGQAATSPKKGYIRVRDSWRGVASRNVNQPHKDAVIHHVDGLQVNIAQPMDHIDEGWATQLAIYSWLLGEEIGSQFIVGIEQLVSTGGGAAPGHYPMIRVATFRSYISEAFQKEVFRKAAKMYYLIRTGHIFDDLSREESDAKCKELDDTWVALSGETEKDRVYREMITASRRQW